MDTIAPFVHEFTYQAMVNDVLPIEDGSKYKCVPLLPIPTTSTLELMP